MPTRSLLIATLLLFFVGCTPDETPTVVVYKTPTCGCCSDWVTHMRENGFEVVAHDVEDVNPIKQRFGLPASLGSCHTALVGDYVVEGHVPAADVQRLLRERPDVTGIAVPGMPIGSPGMEVEGRAAQPYQVISFDRQGRTAVFARH